MQSIQILDVKPFMQVLFQTTELDSYDFVSGEIQTQLGYQLDGHVNPDFFSEEEADRYQPTHTGYLPWVLAKEKVFQIIKGKKTPSQMKLVLRLSPSQSEEILQQSTTYSANEIDGFFVNILFQEQKLNVILGISYKIFTLDKSLEDVFSAYFITFLKHNHITFLS
mgnify:FL=1